MHDIENEVFRNKNFYKLSGLHYFSSFHVIRDVIPNLTPSLLTF